MLEPDFSQRKIFTSDFNQAKYEILRLDESWNKCKALIRAGNLMDWNYELDNIFGELSSDAEKQDEDKDEIKTYSHKIKELNKLAAENQNDNPKLYKILRMKERILRRLQDAAGKGSKRSSEDEDDIDA